MSDVQLNEQGDLPRYTEHTSGAHAVVQKIGIRLRTHRGEWMLDESAGMPFLEWLQRKKPPQVGVENKVRQEIKAVEGVESVTELEVDFERPIETIEVSATVRTEYGEIDVDELITPGS
ncbi:MAG: hypothetical protein ABEN55_19690 [Bradymonadaceae bacterium]